ncbi:NAD-glutamate dehydrogenase [Sphingosinicella ginsenosidimutans]|uniref:NAD-glutamate dehydrogenase n=1 Tax=Allosphingosinicella ginsenosidimutans TaxID=1176539 RepID=A0A5C6TUN0_9SPHN|nr:NAD-glutamate dehydrogenase domain-containing protein [Sphingosinicella ginsenosidimutans]TXC63830.1 NAD-glutamate dehydrogenase [Sphingosinicella ginsenosidimutans]
MNSQNKVAGDAARQRLVEKLVVALCHGALPGELDGFTDDDRRAAAAFVATACERRPNGTPVVKIETTGTRLGERGMRLCVANDNMPFLVDSVAAAISARGLVIHRLLHPVLPIRRDAKGALVDVGDGEGSVRESIMYIEVDRADAKVRTELAAELRTVLDSVRAAVRDWPAMQARMRADAAALDDDEGRALLEWFAGGAMTLLGFEVERPDQPASETLGIFSLPGDPTDEGGSEGAIRYFEKGGEIPLMAKADRKSPVHRHVPLDLVCVPVRENGRITGVGVHVGLWTSQALNAPVEDVPLLRRRLAELEAGFGFDPAGHSGKALRHAMTSLPHDLLINLDTDSVRTLVVTAMSLADRPRPTLVLVRSILKGHLFAFVWLPRDELTTRRRVEIGEMIGTAAKGRQTAWSVDLGDGDLALLRYTYAVSAKQPTPDRAALDAQLDAMVRGWAPAVEARLNHLVGANRAARLTLQHANSFPPPYRSRYPAEDAADDIVRLDLLPNERARSVRLYRLPIDPESQIRMKIYRHGGLIPLSDVVPVLENFGFRVLKETPTKLEGEGGESNIHEFHVATADGSDAGAVMARASVIEAAIAAVLEMRAENDAFNQLIVSVALDPEGVVLLRAWFRYLRQTGQSYGLATVVEALRKAPDVARGLISLFAAMHDPALAAPRDEAVQAAEKRIDKGLTSVAAIDEDRILRLLRGVVAATLRTNAFSPAAEEALAFKLDSAAVPNLPAPRPWREIWVYSPRIEGIHLRGGPIARGGLRWSDRRDDFRTEILGLMKAQLVKNAVIVPTGAKGGFYPKQLPPASDRDAWLAEGTESYRIFIRALLSVTDNIVANKVVHPPKVVIRDGDDPYFVVAADKGTATFSDVANQIATDRKFWLGDAFASGGSYGYDHKAMGITAKGAWVSVQRHFRELGIDVQKDTIRVAGVGDMSGDVFGNGMLLSKAIKLVAAFDHRHIFLDPDPDPATSWKERKRMFNLPRSSWADYDPKLISKGGGVFPRSQKSIPLSREVRALLGIDAAEAEPARVIQAILKARVDLLWFGGIGTYIKASSESHADVGDPGNDAIRVDAADVGARAIGEGANLAITQAGRIEFAEMGGRNNTDFIDNSAGVDCSDNEVNIKIPLNREMLEGRLDFEARNLLLAAMTDEVADLVLEDNRLQTLALSIAERGGAAALPQMVRVIELLEESGRLNRAVEGLESNEDLLRRAQQNRGLTRPELAVLLSTTKMRLQAAIEQSGFTDDPTLEPELLAAFPKAMQEGHREAILQHRLKSEIIATKIANRLVNRLGIIAPFALTEEEGASFGQAAAAFVAAERLFDMSALWADIEKANVDEQVRLTLFGEAATGLQLHVADLLRSIPAGAKPGAIVAELAPGLARLQGALDELLRPEPRADAAGLRARLDAAGAPRGIADRIARLFELDGAVGLALLARRRKLDEIMLTKAYSRLGEVLGLDWAHNAAKHFQPTDQWERLLTAGLSRDFEQLRLDFIDQRGGGDPAASVEAWIADQAPRIEQFRHTVSRARTAPAITVPMLAQIATQARALLAR